jgi:N-dimethylarginine dimethylaminohydrolase
MGRTILMGDPKYFSVRGGANPHTRNVLGIKKKVDAELAKRQWHDMASTLLAHGVEVLVIPADPLRTGLVYPANAGFLYPLEKQTSSAAVADKTFYLANLLPSRASEREVYRDFVRSIGFETRDLVARQEGEADFFPAGTYMLFTHGKIERQRFVLRLGLPPWKRVYGFRSDAAAREELARIANDRPVLDLELMLEAHYHGDTVLCSFGPGREYLLAYRDGLAPSSADLLAGKFGANVIWLAQHDAQMYAANSFQVEFQEKLFLFMPDGVSSSLLEQVAARGVTTVVVMVSEFLAKGGGSVKCMILDMGPSDEQPANPSAVAFREQRGYRRLFGSE